jgi:hypothetical protein
MLKTRAMGFLMAGAVVGMSLMAFVSYMAQSYIASSCKDLVSLPAQTTEEKEECVASARRRQESTRVTNHRFGGQTLTILHKPCERNHYLSAQGLSTFASESGGEHVPFNDLEMMLQWCETDAMAEDTYLRKCTYYGHDFEKRHTVKQKPTRFKKRLAAVRLPTKDAEQCAREYNTRCYDETFFAVSPPASSTKLCSPSGGNGEADKSLCGFPRRDGHSSSQVSAALRQRGCRIYSLGSNNEWGFEAQMLRDTACDIYTFDCTTDPKIPANLANSGRHFFYPWCVGNGKKMPKHSWMAKRMEQLGRSDSVARTYANVTGSLGHKTVDLLKMDIEGYEWGVFGTMLQDHHKQLLGIQPLGHEQEAPYILPFQIAYEQHMGDVNTGEYRDRKDLIQLARDLSDLGYVVVDRHDNMGTVPGGASEITAVLAWC